MPKFSGRVLSVIHHSSDDTFYVFTLSVEASSEQGQRGHVISVRGNLHGLTQIKVGSAFEVIGSWVEHPKYGRQIALQGWEPYAKTPKDVIRFLDECVGVIDRGLLEIVVEKFGVDTYDVLTDEPDRARFLFGEDDPRRVSVDNLIELWNSIRSRSVLSAFLQTLDLDAGAVRAVFQTFGKDSLRIIRANPYRLLVVPSFTFARADKVAFQLGLSRSDPRRVEGALIYLLKQEASQGHLFLRLNDLPDFVTEFFRSEHVDPFGAGDLRTLTAQAVNNLVAENFVRVDREVGAYLAPLYQYERESATKLAKFVTPVQLDIDLDAFLTDYERGHNIVLSSAQSDAVRKLVTNRVLVLTGLPGTGKSTVVKTFVRLFRATGISFQLMAPTGIAAKRLSAVTGESAMTIHRTFLYDGESWGYDNYNKFVIGAVIIDETSMVDQELFYRVLDALDPSTMLVLVGDDAQLPSVGPGNVLRELVSCPELPRVRLTQIFRQRDASDIVHVSHQINRGEIPQLVRDKTAEFQFAPCLNEEKIADLIVQIAVRLKARDANFQVLSMKYEGVVGVDNLNQVLREALNSGSDKAGQKEWASPRGKLHMRVGDRVMVIKNDYKLGVYNGDMGKLIDITRDDAVVRIHGIGSGSVDTVVQIPLKDAAEKLRLAYAISCHKSQGSEYETIILPVVRSQGRMLQRNIIYTGITRARKKVYLIGDPLALSTAISNDQVLSRNTALGRAVSESLRLGVLPQDNNGGEESRRAISSGSNESGGTPRLLNPNTEGAVTPVAE